MNLTAEDLKKLSAPFPKDVLGVKVQSLSKARDKAMLVFYLQHTDVYDRLESVDPGWSCGVLSEVVHEVPSRSGELEKVHVVRTFITLKHATRENVGEGDTPKAALSDSLKRTAMLFGVGRSLYDSALVWVPYNESTDRFKTWTVADYDRFAKPAPSQSAAPRKASPPTVKASSPIKPVVAVDNRISNMLKSMGPPDQDPPSWVTEAGGHDDK